MICGKRRENCALLTGILFILLGSFFLLFWEKVQQNLIKENLKLSKTSKTYEPWIKSQVPIYVQYYFFNWTNPADMKDPNYKPVLKEVGPYKFCEKIEKVNITWNQNGTVSYRRIRRWYFDSEGSRGTLGDKITTINTIALMAARLVKSMSSLGRIPMNMMIASTQKIPVTKTVGEFLFEGYVDPLLTTGRQLPVISSKVPYDKFGWFYKRNGSSTFDGIYNVQTGDNGMDLFGSVSLWNNKNKTGFYEGKCGEVKGSGGEYWPWDRKKETNVYLFSPDLCRYIEYKFSEEISIEGLNGYKYVADADLFDNGTVDSGNECFCNGQCLAAGVLNISVCRFGAPVFTSYPHFYLADAVYADSVVGMKPERNLHENYILIEPTYGMPMDIAARFQINVLVQPINYVALLNGVRQILFPVLWLDQRVLVPSKKLFVIKILTHIPAVIFILSIFLIFIGIICLLSFARCRAVYNQRVFKIKSGESKSKRNRKLNSSLETEESFLHKKERIPSLEMKSPKPSFIRSWYDPLSTTHNLRGFNLKNLNGTYAMNMSLLLHSSGNRKLGTSTIFYKTFYYAEMNSQGSSRNFYTL